MTAQEALDRMMRDLQHIVVALNRQSEFEYAMKAQQALVVVSDLESSWSEFEYMELPRETCSVEEPCHCGFPASPSSAAHPWCKHHTAESEGDRNNG